MRSVARRLFEHAWPYRAQLAGMFLLSLLSSPLALLAPLPLKIGVDHVVHSQPLPAWLARWLPESLQHSPQAVLLVAAGMLVTVALLDQLRSMASDWLTAYTSERFLRNFRAQLFHHVQRLSLSYHDTKGTSDSVYRIQYDAISVQRVAIEGVVPFVGSTLTLLAMAYVTIRIYWPLALVSLTVGPAIYLLSRSYRKRLRDQSREVRRIESSALGIVHEALGGLRVVRAFGQEGREEARFGLRSQEGLRARLRLVLAQGRLGLWMAALASLGAAGVLFFGVHGVRSGALTLGDLLLVMGYVAQFEKPIKTMGRKMASLQAQLAGAERAFALLDESPDVVEHPRPQRLGRARGALTFSNVSFSYDSERPALGELSFAIDPGTCLGIIGATGSGKTTLVNLLARFYDPTAGAIFLDGVDLRDYALVDLRRQFAMVLQDPVLFSTSIAENIAYARPDASEADLIAAARAAGAHDFILRLPNGYHTPVGERGLRLSGGERQRISIARAFLKDAPILILDEPTSAVDLRTESIIVQALERLMQGRTTLLITHRMSALKHCRLILNVEDGRLIREARSSPLRLDPSEEHFIA